MPEEEYSDVGSASDQQQAPHRVLPVLPKVPPADDDDDETYSDVVAPQKAARTSVAPSRPPPPSSVSSSRRSQVEEDEQTYDEVESALPEESYYDDAGTVQEVR